MSEAEQVIVEPGRKEYPASTGKRWVFRRVPSVLTVSFHLDAGALSSQEHPRYVLESDDGAYRVEKTPKDDLVKGDAYLQLRFDALIPGKTYTLKRWLDPDHCEVVFQEIPWARVVDQPRAVAEQLEGSGFAKLGGGAVEEAGLDPDAGVQR